MKKQVIVWRKDLNCRLGKKMAQAAHASLAAVLSNSFVIRKAQRGIGKIFTRFMTCFRIFLKCWTIYSENNISGFLITPLTSKLDGWLYDGKFTKIVVGVNSEEELLKIYNNAKNQNMITSLIKDAGKTEFHNIPTHTVIAIGPEESDKIDKITGNLKLL